MEFSVAQIEELRRQFDLEKQKKFEEKQKEYEAKLKELEMIKFEEFNLDDYLKQQQSKKQEEKAEENKFEPPLYVSHFCFIYSIL